MVHEPKWSGLFLSSIVMSTTVDHLVGNATTELVGQGVLTPEDLMDDDNPVVSLVIETLIGAAKLSLELISPDFFVDVVAAVYSQLLKSV